MTPFGDPGSYQRFWRPVSIADAARVGGSWSRRNEALDQLDDLTFEHQMAAAASAAGHRVSAADLKTRPQRGPLHTDYPAFPAARACIGLSAICEFNAQAGSANLLLQAAVKLSPDQLAVLDPTGVRQAASHVAEAVGHRLCLDHLCVGDKFRAVESYRLFAASMLDLRFRRLKDVILAACTLGDLVDGLSRRPNVRRRIHPLTLRILSALAPSCAHYRQAAGRCRPEELPALAAALARGLMSALLPFLPLKTSDAPDPARLERPGTRALSRSWSRLSRVPLQSPSRNPDDPRALSAPLLGLNEPAPPVMDQPSSWTTKRRPDAAPGPSHFPRGIPSDAASGDDGADQRVLVPRAHSQEEARVQGLIQQAAAVITQATAAAAWEDPRVDQVTHSLRTNLFGQGPLEAQLGGHRHQITAYGSGRKGVIHEGALPRCRDAESLRQVRNGAAPIAQKLRAYQWFGRRTEMQAKRLQSRGALDPHRLARLGISSLVRRRWRRRRVTDYRGRPLVILAKDGSSSNTAATTLAGKTLAAAFLMIERLARIRLFAADYSSDHHGHLVQWLWHPQKTPGRNAWQAVEAVASLPPHGQGGNEDVLSLSHIVREVLLTPDAAKQTVIVINITDGKINSPLSEFRSMIRTLRQTHRLTYSLVVLGDAPIEVPEADHVVRVPRHELGDSHRIADRIAQHVNTLVRALRAGRKASHG
ncbi:MAG: VWA domain-containing protein [Verrucomicrobia bacterium]|nr:VWA domain-containing protein [Verrucomicrobiota bacterium]